MGTAERQNFAVPNPHTSVSFVNALGSCVICVLIMELDPTRDTFDNEEPTFVRLIASHMRERWQKSQS